MVVFTIPGDKTRYKYPEGPHEITFDQFVGYLDIAAKAPQIIKDIETAIDAGDRELVERLYADMTPPVMAKDVYPYFAKVVSFFTHIPASVIKGDEGPGMNVQQLEALYNLIVRAMAPPPYAEYEYQQEIQFKGETWVIPDRLMENASVIEFAEAAQFQAVMQEVEAGQFRALIDVCAVLLRKPGEKYSDNIYKRNRKLFGDLPMDSVWKIAFFLMRRSAKLSRDFQIYTASRTLGRLKRELRNSRLNTVGT